MPRNFLPPRRAWLCMPPLVFALVDYGVTMAGQPPEYWNGNFEAAFEGNPLVRWCMTVHPWMFHGLTVLWVIAFTAFILWTPRGLARFGVLAVAFAHAFCIGTWMYDREDGFFRSLALCIACAILVVIAFELGDDLPVV